jgi:hypothetical protein
MGDAITAFHLTWGRVSSAAVLADVDALRQCHLDGDDCRLLWRSVRGATCAGSAALLTYGRYVCQTETNGLQHSVFSDPAVMHY